MATTGKRAAPAPTPAKAAKTTAVVKWDVALAARAHAAKKAEASVSVGDFVSLRGGIMSYGGNPVPGNRLDVIVVDSILENTYFDGAYDPDKPQSPACYAFGRDEDEMAPHEAVAEPVADSCAGCPNNEWGSADVGRGKACKNVRRLALITADALDDGEEGVTDADVAYLKVPVTSVRAWAGYVNQLAATDKPPLAFVTEISVVPDAGSQFKVVFKAKSPVEDGALIGALLAKADVVAQTIAFPYQPAEAQAAQRPHAKAAQRQPAKTTEARTPASARAAEARERISARNAPATGHARRRKF